MSSPTCRTFWLASTGCSDALNPGRPDTATIGFTPTRSAAANAFAAMLVGNVDGAQLCVGERRANEGDVFHTREADIADKLAAPAQEAVVLLALDRGAYALIAHLQPSSAATPD